MGHWEDSHLNILVCILLEAEHLYPLASSNSRSFPLNCYCIVTSAINTEQCLHDRRDDEECQDK